MTTRVQLKKKLLVVSLKGLLIKISGLAVNRQSWSNSDSDISVESFWLNLAQVTEQRLVKTVTAWDSVYYKDRKEDVRSWAVSVSRSSWEIRIVRCTWVYTKMADVPIPGARKYWTPPWNLNVMPSWRNFPRATSIQSTQWHWKPCRMHTG
jgi:hypothetical protein